MTSFRDLHSLGHVQAGAATQARHLLDDVQDPALRNIIESIELATRVRENPTPAQLNGMQNTCILAVNEYVRRRDRVEQSLKQTHGRLVRRIEELQGPVFKIMWRSVATALVVGLILGALGSAALAGGR